MQKYLSCTCDNHVRSWLRNGIHEWQLTFGVGPADPGCRQTWPTLETPGLFLRHPSESVTDESFAEAGLA